MAWRFTRVLAFVMALLLVSLHAEVQAQNTAPSIGSMNLTRADNELLLSAQVSFDLAPQVQDAVVKGIPLVFVAEVDISRDRWYWYDKKVAVAVREIRLSYQPLTRRWRLNAGALGGVSLPQYFENFSEAIASVKRLNRWRIAELADLDLSAAHTIELRFKLDLSQLPRPFQIGLIGNNDWSIVAAKSMRLTDSVK